METLVDIKSPFTGGRVKEIRTIEEHEFRKEMYMVHVRYYQCVDTGEQFTTSEQDNLLLNELYGQYRERHGIPFADEIRSIRVRYGLNLTQISKILGFGLNQYAQYEKGEVPSESNGKMIRTAGHKANMLMLLENSREEFDKEEYEKVRLQILAVKENPVDEWEKRLFFDLEPRSIYNGFAVQVPERVKNLVLYVVHQLRGISPTKLNKLLFYIDFVHYRQYGSGISGLRYRAIQYGPVPNHYETIYDHIGGLEMTVHVDHNAETRSMQVKAEPDMSIFAPEEVQTISTVLDRLGSMSTGKLVDLSHKEQGWQLMQGEHNLVPFTYAFDLKGC